MVVTAFAWVVSGIVTSVIGHLIYEPPAPPKAAEAPQVARNRARPAARADYDVVVERDLFKVSRNKPADVNIQVAGDADRPLAQMGISLRGTITGPREISRAVIEDTGEQKLYRIGDSVKNATIIAILRNKVIMDVNGQQQMLVVEEQAGGPARVASARARLHEPRRPRMAQPTAADAVRNLDKLVGNARVVPYYRGGQPYGFRVSDVVEGSEIYNQGMRTGDIIKAVNGIPIKTPQDALNAYQELQNSSSVQLEVERQGASIPINVSLK
jgi:general secretion pathway protein C